jgi:thiamine-phosphate pyrophosphorylase
MENRRHSAEKGPHAEAMSMASRRDAPRLYLVTPPLREAGAIADDLAAALNAAEIAAVLVRFATEGERDIVETTGALRILIQSNGAALLLDGHPGLVARTQADGAHLTGADELKTAVATLKPSYIAGCGGLASRHDAMFAGESGADYVMFGEADHDGHRPRFAAVLERVAWWAEVMTIPCVGYAAEPDEVAPLAQAGADFIALDASIWRGHLRAAIDALTRVAEPAP